MSQLQVSMKTGQRKLDNMEDQDVHKHNEKLWAKIIDSLNEKSIESAGL